eukprot:4740064-Pleurochrysis_carterae.AAC.1
MRQRGPLAQWLQQSCHEQHGSATAELGADGVGERRLRRKVFCLAASNTTGCILSLAGTGGITLRRRELQSTGPLANMP